MNVPLSCTAAACNVNTLVLSTSSAVLSNAVLSYSPSCVAELRVVTAASLRCCGRFFALFAGIVQVKRRSQVNVSTAVNELLPGTFHRESHSNIHGAQRVTAIQTSFTW